MTSTSIVYNNKIMDIRSFIEKIFTLNEDIIRIPSCEIHECNDSYSITLKSFMKDTHTFQIYYKNSFLILQIRLKKNLEKVLSTRMFFLPDININKISHNYYGDSTTIKISKIIF